jgi:hypothetical protein
MIANEFCEICHEEFSEGVSTVNCGSEVPHKLCDFCEGEWRSKMRLQENGMRIMNCPTCRRPEQDRTKESLQREVIRLNRLLADITTTTTTTALEAMEMGEISADGAEFLEGLFDGMDFGDFSFTLPPSVTVRRPRRAVCASGRGGCHSRSQSGVTVTRLKCTLCKVVFCCRNCNTCVGCAPA